MERWLSNFLANANIVASLIALRFGVLARNGHFLQEDVPDDILHPVERWMVERQLDSQNER